jgi:hypothetical protein
MKGKLSSPNLCLVLILAVGLFMRLYNFEKSFSFAHDQDLYSWIAKDIVINHHQRLVGQVTSVDGVFIGGFYYYLMSIFYAISGMNPLSAVIPLTAIGLFNIWSFNFVVGKHYGKKAGLWAAFIYAVSFGAAQFDRWSVPTQPTITWSIWFLEVILEMVRGNLKWLPLYGFLAGFVWQLHIALLPVLPLPIVAYLVSGSKISHLWNKWNLRTTIIAILVFVVTMSPLLIFETKYDFSQVKSIIAATKKDLGGLTGLPKFLKVIDASGREVQQRLLFGFEFKQVYWIWIITLLIMVSEIKCKKISINEAALLLIMFAQYFSKRVVSEYYFTNVIPIVVMLLAIFLANYVSLKLGYLMALVYLVANVFWLVLKSDSDQSYFYRIKVVDFIKQDVASNNYPCIAVNFISDTGVGVGFRYLFWYKGITLVKPGTPGVPVYNIPIPWQISQSEVAVHYGRFGVIRPVQVKIDSRSCTSKEYQLDPLLGYTE